MAIKAKTLAKAKATQTAIMSGEMSLESIKAAERQRLAAIDSGLLDHRLFLKPCTVKILMLVDNGISYNQFYFGLSEVLDTLRNNPEWWVNFDITRAHRQTDPNPPTPGSPAETLYAPHFQNFRFTQAGFDLDDYDEVWFYGFNSSESTSGAVPPALKDDELGVLFRWMDNGGGVFATGDHFNLGASLCSRIPRVRNMRKWTVADGVPSNVGPDRHDTLVKGHDYAGTPGVDESTRYTFDDESDDVPMNIRLRWYHHHHCGPHIAHSHWHWPYFVKRSPHPVLCGRDGPITILPDHPHEGEVVVPADLTAMPAYDGYSAPEYPHYNGSALAPEIIAWARVQDDHGPSPISFKGPANAKEFGAVGAYNGHCVNVGRVVVDSTWHHWFDVNLTGRMVLFNDTPGNVETGDPRKLNGFNDTPQGQAALNRIRNYFRNVAIWLAPKHKLRCMALRALWGGIHRFPLHADLQLHMPIWVIGHHAIDVLGKFAGQCQVLRWWPVIIATLPLEKLFDPDRLKVPVETVQMIDEFMLGGIIHGMLEAKESGKFVKRLPSDKALQKMAEQGARTGVDAIMEHLNQTAQTNKHLTAVIREGLG